MNNTEYSVCVQIGLNREAEYLYLTSPNWRKEMENVNPIKALPKALHHISKWDYYGIDCDPASISLMLHTHPQHECVKWIQACIDGEDGQVVTMLENWHGEIKGYPFCVPFFTTTVTLDTLIKGLCLEKIDVLALDIEGAELKFFQTYQWHIYPTYIAVEIHDAHDGEHPVEYFETRKIIQDILQERGYEMTLHKKWEGRTEELQFLYQG